jgi:TonB-dependent SusC/RagA subfamily outer membrane receptor
MSKLKILLPCFLLLISWTALAQPKTVTGSISDPEGKPLANVSVQVLNSSIGTTTNATGQFTIQVPNSDAVLVFSMVGFTTQQVRVGNNQTVQIRLKGGTQNLQEVVVTALGITRDRRTLGYSTQKINNEAIVDKGEGGLLNTLQGKIAGADITGASGAAGASTTIILRGVTSFTGNQAPLMVVDGIPISDNVDESTVGLYSNQSSNRSMDLNVNNIESVNVLSGPAAAALYGSRAAHGAIMITTKKGSGQKGVVNVIS